MTGDPCEQVKSVAAVSAFLNSNDKTGVLFNDNGLLGFAENERIELLKKFQDLVDKNSYKEGEDIPEGKKVGQPKDGFDMVVEKFVKDNFSVSQQYIYEEIVKDLKSTGDFVNLVQKIKETKENLFTKIKDTGAEPSSTKVAIYLAAKMHGEKGGIEDEKLVNFLKFYMNNFNDNMTRNLQEIFKANGLLDENGNLITDGKDKVILNFLKANENGDSGISADDLGTFYASLRDYKGDGEEGSSDGRETNIFAAKGVEGKPKNAFSE